MCLDAELLKTRKFKRFSKIEKTTSMKSNQFQHLVIIIGWLMLVDVG